MRISAIKKKLIKSFTIMIIPHNTSSPLRFHISSSFLIFMFVLWTGVTIWAGYISSQNIDYWRMKMGNQILKLKVEFFAQEIKDTREMLDQIYQVDSQLRTMLGMKSKKSLVEGDATGGPTSNDQEDLGKMLSDRISDMTQSDINRQINVTKYETDARMESFLEIRKYINLERSLYRAKPNMWPTKGGYISSSYGWRISPKRKTSNEFHSAMDICVKKGSPVFATADGKVKLAGWEGGYGKVIVLEHMHRYSTRYAHLSKIKVASGDTVKRGQLIGHTGNTGVSTGPHLHYEVWHKSKTVNPYYFISKNKKGRKR